MKDPMGWEAWLTVSNLVKFYDLGKLSFRLDSLQTKWIFSSYRPISKYSNFQSVRYATLFQVSCLVLLITTLPFWEKPHVLKFSAFIRGISQSLICQICWFGWVKIFGFNSFIVSLPQIISNIEIKTTKLCQKVRTRCPKNFAYFNFPSCFPCSLFSHINL